MTEHQEKEVDGRHEDGEKNEAETASKKNAVRLNQLETFALAMVQQCVGDTVEITTQDKTLPGTPDLIIPMLKLVIFIDGQFWHDGKGAPMKRVAIRYLADDEPEKAEFWHQKSVTNAKRDREANKKLRQLVYKIVRLKEERLNGYDPLGYVSRAIGLSLFKTK